MRHHDPGDLGCGGAVEALHRLSQMPKASASRPSNMSWRPSLGLAINNAVIDIDGPEMPILDGSAMPFVAAIMARGLQKQIAQTRAIRVLKRVEVRDGEALARLEPAEMLEIDFRIDFADPAIGRQSRKLNMATAPSSANSATAGPSAAIGCRRHARQGPGSGRHAGKCRGVRWRQRADARWSASQGRTGAPQDAGRARRSFAGRCAAASPLHRHPRRPCPDQPPASPAFCARRAP